MVESLINILKLSLRVLEAVWFYVRGIARKIKDDDILFLASGLAFNGIFTMIPLMLLTASAIGIFLNSSEAGIRQLHDLLNAAFPPQPFATSIKESILTMVSDIIAYRTSLGVFGILVLLWTATSLFDALRSVLHAIYRIPRTKGLLSSLLHDLGFIFLVFLLFLASNISLWIVSLIEQIAGNMDLFASLDFSLFKDTLPTLIIFLLTGCMFYIIYRYIPDSKPPKAAGVISTLTTSVVWIVSARLFALYLSEFSAIGTLYGAYAFILVLLIWIYYSSIIFILGGIVGQIYWERLKLKESGKLERWV